MIDPIVQIDRLKVGAVFTQAFFQHRENMGAQVIAFHMHVAERAGG